MSEQPPPESSAESFQTVYQETNDSKEEIKDENPKENPKRNSTPEATFSESQQVICSIIPSLNGDRHKGQCGRVGVIGGSREYTGAPYFAAISALKCGADLVYVFATTDSAPVIKTYSPELIVFPVLDQVNRLDDITKLLPRIHSLIIGPGLGRDENILSIVASLISYAKAIELPVVIDADALYFVSKSPDIIRNYKRAILTPNMAEFDRLFTSVFRQESHTDLNDPTAVVQELARNLGNVTILRKGPVDIVSDGVRAFICDEAGSNRRCGGQGDILCGSIGTFNYWSHNAFNSCQMATTAKGSIYEKYTPTIIAAMAGSMLTRRCSRLAFAKHGRSTTTTNLIKEIKNSFTSLFPVD